MMILRVCERFGLDPTRWDSLGDAWRSMLLAYGKVREMEEAARA